MPQGLGWIIGVLAIGYLLLFAELFLPGGVIGVLGLLAVIYGCYLAFGLGGLWGSAAIILSIVVTGLAVHLFFRSRLGRRLVLSEDEGKTWKAQEDDLEGLVGKAGTALTSLRPAGLADLDGRRVDVVTDGQFVERSRPVRVVEVEGNRVMVEEIEESTEISAAAS